MPTIVTRFKIVAAALLACTLLIAAPSPAVNEVKAAAAVPKLDQIRVALFIDAGSKYKSIGKLATVSSTGGLQVASRQASGSANWVNAAAGVKLRFSLEQYELLLAQTSDYNQAKSLYAKMANSDDQGYIVSRSLKNQTVYQVYSAPYATNADALKARDRLKKNTAVSALLTGDQPVSGPLHWDAGSFASAADAASRLSAVSALGIPAGLALRDNGKGALVYSVYAGEAADQDALNQLKSQLAAGLPNVTLSAVDGKAAYLLLKSDASAGNTAATLMNHYQLSSAAKIWVAGVKANVKLAERSQRSYRGGLEISSSNSRIAVINELPFEQYLYGVVSSEIGAEWPAEALKAQAVAARTFALAQGNKYQIAHISDTTVDQAYNGADAEFSAAVKAVQATEGEVITNASGLITPFYSANTGGMSADGTEVWGKPINYVQSVPSPDEVAQKGKMNWIRVATSAGLTGYIREDYLKATGQSTESGFPYYTTIQDAVNLRPAPFVDNTINAPIAKLANGEQVVYLEKTIESNSYSWIRGPYDAATLSATLKSKLNKPINGTLQTLEVTERGTSGRVTELSANGTALSVAYPDVFRSGLNGLLSTRFDIDEMARLTILGADGAQVNLPVQKDGAVYVLGADADAPAALDVVNPILLNAAGNVRITSQTPQFRFIGFGYGHGLGMSQWGMKGLAELGYDYQKILKYYYKEVSIVKD